jgi:hypothetical protein
MKNLYRILLKKTFLEFFCYVFEKKKILYSVVKNIYDIKIVSIEI